MRFEQLKYLLSIKETNSITRTAEKMLISHQAVSKAIKSLEDELSITILNRSAQGVSFTPAGLEVCLFAEKILFEESIFLQNIAQYQMPETPSLLSETLNIYAVPRYITPHFLSFIEKIQLSYPKAKLMLHNVTTKYFTQNIRFDENTIFLCTVGYDRSKYDLNFVELPPELNTFLKKNNLSYLLLDAQKLYACVHKSSKLAIKKMLTTDDLATFPSVSFTYTFEQFDSKFVIDNFDQQKQLIKQGNCFGRYTRQEFANFYSKNYFLIPFENEPTLFFIAFYHQNTENKLINIFMNQIMEQIVF